MDIRTIAQTNIALYRQMHELGYPLDALELVRKTHTLACTLFTSRFRATDKPFLCHLVGTASILAHLNVSPILVAVGLLHAAYEAGNFGLGSPGPTKRNRAYVRSQLGDAVEEGIYRYGRTPWNHASISQLAQRIELISEQEREILILRLANELEDHLDLAMSYCAEARRKIDESFPLFAPIAQALGFEGLAIAFRDVATEMQRASWTAPLATGRHASYQLDPMGSLDLAGAIRRLRRAPFARLVR